MTMLDAAVLALLGLVSAGGYHQGLLRGLTRLSALAVIGLTTLILSTGISSGAGVQALLLRTLALCAAVTLAVGGITWFVNRAIPQPLHHTRLNKVLGVLPALLQGLLVASLVLGLVHRLALEPQTQRYLADGLVTGPLILPVSWVEQSLAGSR